MADHVIMGNRISTCIVKEVRPLVRIFIAISGISGIKAVHLLPCTWNAVAIYVFEAETMEVERTKAGS